MIGIKRESGGHIVGCHLYHQRLDVQRPQSVLSLSESAPLPMGEGFSVVLQWPVEKVGHFEVNRCEHVAGLTVRHAPHQQLVGYLLDTQ